MCSFVVCFVILIVIQICLSKIDTEESFHVSDGKSCHWKETNDQEFISLSHEIMQCMNRAVKTDSYPVSEPPHWYDVECEENLGLLSLSVASQRMIQLAQTAKSKGMDINISVFGDSVMTQQMFHLACMINHNIEMQITHEDDFTIFNIVLDNVKIRHYPFSYLPDIDHNVNKLLGKYVNASLHHPSSPYDILVLNYGLFVNEMNQFPLYETLLHQILHTYTEAAASAATKHHHVLPMFIWRETTPQHFPSSNGWFDSACPFGHAQCHCVSSLTDDMRNGGINIPISASFNSDKNKNKMCRPVCMNANSRNMIANSLILKTNEMHNKSNNSINNIIHINHIYNAMEVINNFNIHYSDIDCTHISLLPLNLMNRVLLSTILKKHNTHNHDNHSDNENNENIIID